MAQVNRVVNSRTMLLVLTCVFVATMFFVAIKVTVVASATNAVRDLGQSQECRAKISSDYSNKLDHIFETLNDRAAFQEAVVEFQQFKLGPHGKPETRDQRTKRLCPDAS